MMNGLNKNIRRDKLTKMEGTSTQGILKTQLEIVEVDNASICPHRYSMNFYTDYGMYQAEIKKRLEYTTSKNRVPG